jgi:phospholipid/cholesterol/gamma-HCH transport system permease protein
LKAEQLNATGFPVSSCEALHLLDQVKPVGIMIDASQVSYCDGAGAAFLVNLQHYMAHLGWEVSIHGLQVKFRSLLDMYVQVSRETPPRPLREPLSLVEQAGHAAVLFWQDVRVLIIFVGELSVGLLIAATHPRRIRWKDVFVTAERAGVNAFLLSH